MTKEREGAVTETTAKGSNHQEKLDWTQVSPGGVIVASGSSVDYQTGDWRSERPVIHFDRCIQCLFCYVYCPDGAIMTKDQKVTGVDYFHCKGCGICSVECPVKCISMVDEAKALKEDEAAAVESSGKGAR